MSTLQEVAKQAEVSIATASRALHLPDKVALKTREKVLAAAQATGYRPNALAQGLRHQESRHLGLVITDLNPFHAVLAKGVQDTAEQYDLNVLLFTSDDTEYRERRALETLRGYMPQGLILIPTSHTAGHRHLLADIPTVEVDRVTGHAQAHAVRVDNQQSARQIITHLLDLGHRKVAAIFGTPDVSTATERIAGFEEAFEERGLKADKALFRYGDNHEASGYTLCLELLKVPVSQRPTALFVSNLEMCVGAIRAIHELKLAIPQDLSLVAFDDGRILQVHQPPITTVVQPTYELGVAACKLLVDILEKGEKLKSQNVVLPAQLAIRESTGPPP